MMLTILFSIFYTLVAPNPSAESADRWLVETKSNDPSCFIDWLDTQALEREAYQFKKLPLGNWWSIEIPSRLSSSLKQQPCISRILEDKKITWRKQPNDPAYINQGDMNLIGMTKAWDITTGGLTTTGDTIVVALIDDGYDLAHPDLNDNFFINYGEVADDGEDNDQDGFVDNYLGYNVSLENDNHPSRTHGTSVAGVIGAEGNNNTGVTGVNWHVKLLLISGADFESSLIEAYQYILDMRNLYTSSGGTKGAFVVVNNLSGGIDYAFAADHPLWCEMYDKLGEKGILSVAAAPNESISVDVEGDMPTTCTSPYLITVTNVDLSDELVGNAGYGAVSIDLGAPGHGTVTTAGGGQYKDFQGTSAAAPHVAGAIGLLYSSPCTEFFYDLETNPSATASRIRNLVLSTGKPNNALNEITVTGKRLQVDALLQASVTDCGIPIDPTIEILSIVPNPSISTKIRVNFKVTGDITGTYFEVFDALGAKVREDIPVDVVNAELGYIEIDPVNLLAGVYFLIMRRGDQKVSRKIVVVI